MTTTGTGQPAFPYRFVAEDGMHEGTTFVYQAGGIVISYETASPGHYFRTGPPAGPFGTRESARYPMTADMLACFEAVPLRDDAGLQAEGPRGSGPGREAGDMTETAAKPTAEQVTLATIRQHVERMLALAAAVGVEHERQSHAAGYDHACRDVLAILDMHGRPAHEPVIFRGPGDETPAG